MLELLKNDKVQRVVMGVLVIILIILLFKQCEATKSAERRGDQNAKAASEGMKKYFEKDSSLTAEKYSYLVKSIADLEKYNKDLYEQFKKWKDKDVVGGTSSTLTYSPESKTITTNIVQNGLSGTVTVKYDTIVEKTGFRRHIQGYMPFNIKDSLLYTQPFVLSKDIIKFKVSTGFVKDDKRNYKVLGNVSGMDMDIDVDGALVESQMSGYKEPWLQFGLQAGVGLHSIKPIGFVPYIGVGVSIPFWNIK